MGQGKEKAGLCPVSFCSPFRDAQQSSRLGYWPTTQDGKDNDASGRFFGTGKDMTGIRQGYDTDPAGMVIWERTLAALVAAPMTMGCMFLGIDWLCNSGQFSRVSRGGCRLKIRRDN